MGALQKEKTNYTYADYKGLELNEGERFEIIRGKAFAMSAPNAGHQAILAALASQFSDFLEDKPHKVYPAPYDVRLFYREDESDDTIVQPDIVVVCDEKKRGQEGCRGAPDLTVEILSPSNTAIEMEQKLNLYREAGVREYWVIDPENLSLTVYCFREVGSIYNYKNTATVPVAVLPGLMIELERVFKKNRD
jgi:Uma2 family endonuclease